MAEFMDTPFRFAGMPQGGSPVVDREKLMQEYRENESKIAELKNRLANARADMDARDMRLAANRASVGDMGTSMAHQLSIEDRAYRTASEELASIEREKAARADREYEKQKLIEAIEDLDIYAPKDAESRNMVDVKRRRLVNELRDKFGVEYNVAPAATATGDNSANWTPDEWQKFAIENIDDDGNWKSAEARDKYEKFAPKNAAEATAKKENLNRATADEAAAKKAAAAAAEKKAVEAAIDEAIKNYSAWNLKNGESKTYTAKNGRTVTVTRVNGKKRYSIGKTYKER